jgi:uncharacterized protein (TIGR02118 family)
MIKLVYCIRKSSGVDETEFNRYWLENHGPLVRSVASALGATRYVQSHTVQPELNALLARSRGCAPAYDGVTEVWWDDIEAFNHGLNSPEGRAAALRLLEDEARFIDLAQSRVFLTEERVIFDAISPAEP